MKKYSIVEKIIRAFMLLLNLYEKYYWSEKHIKETFDLLKPLSADIIIANDLETLPLALKLFKKGRVVFDAHEYSPRQFEDRFFWRVLFHSYKDYLCRKYLSKTDLMLTVSDGIAEEYNKNYGVKPKVITNAPFYTSINVTTTVSHTIKIIHHGVANPSRYIENMIKVMDHVDERFRLDLMLTGSNYPSYYELIRKMTEDHRNIRLIPPVEMNNIINAISQYDIGLYILKPLSFNSEMALPNKIFEFIQARIAVAIGPSTEMMKIVKRYDCGIISPDFTAEAMATLLNNLDNRKIDYYKEQADNAAKILSADHNKVFLLKLLDDI